LVEEQADPETKACLDRNGQCLVDQLDYACVITRLHRGIRLRLERLHGVHEALRFVGRPFIGLPRGSQVAAAGAVQQDTRAREQRPVSRRIGRLVQFVCRSAATELRMLPKKVYVLLATLDEQQLTDGLTSCPSCRRVLDLLGALRAVPGPFPHGTDTRDAPGESLVRKRRTRMRPGLTNAMTGGDIAERWYWRGCFRSACLASRSG